MKIFEKIREWFGFKKIREYYLPLLEINYKIEEEDEKIKSLERIIEKIRSDIYEKYHQFIIIELISPGNEYELVEQEDRNIWSVLVEIPENILFSHQKILKEIINLLEQEELRIGKIKKIKKK